MPSLRRLFHHFSPSVSDDLADLEECFRNNSFALVPSALTPSRAPSNSIIAAARALFFYRPVRLDFTSGLDKGPISDWYNEQRAKGSTAIKKIQLRKDYQHPYYHEYIIISTGSGHSYRVDRRPDPDAPFDTIMKTGCIAYDTIQEVDLTSLKDLDKTSSCVVELHWQGKEIIDLLFILSICFAIHNDKLSDRYTLQRYNCYFLSWAIIVITMRKSAVFGAVSNTGKGVPERVGEPELELEAEKLTVRLELEQMREVKRVWGSEWERELVRELVRELMRELVRELELKRMQELKRVSVRELGQELELVRARARVQVRERAREWAHGLGQIPLVLAPMKSVALRKIVSFSSEGREGLSRSYINVISHMMENTADQYQTALNIADFPALFSVLLNNNLGPVKSKTPHRNILKPAELERHIVEVIERHATRVARWGLGSAAEVRSDILAGIWRTWQAMSR